MPPNATSATRALSESLSSTNGASSENQSDTTTGVLYECDAETTDGGLVKNIEKFKGAEKRKLKLVWRNIIAFTYLHIAALYGAWLMLSSAKWPTIVTGM